MNEMHVERPLRGHNYVFSGGTAGIGLAAATAIARRGPAILLLGRDAERGERAAAQVRAAGAEEAVFRAVDLTTMAGVGQAIEAIGEWRPVLHGLVHTAMTAAMRRVDTAEGFERAFGLQYLARYALNRGLLAALASSGDGRIVHVGAKAPKGLLPDLDDLHFERRRWSLLAALMSSQVLGYLHVQAAAQRWRDLPVTASIVCVGMTRTDTVRGWPWFIRGLYRLFGTSPERSAANVVGLLTAADVRRANGAIFFDPRRFEPTPMSFDPALARRTWELSEGLARSRGLVLPEDGYVYKDMS
ncbi:SDR family NAD(P)-dependent oxidoreductase [Nannocystis punicea]|uniref:SDR family NAD(P)-dependent oxidoreductase n=1 Tax=Nannocystis punicea TaxID=2995304 RepID=A0ABY7H7M1_9BACT|nr:SDR family NAD(P)-dependent oxidoreductase [Nannocystis poenicansa]WAS95263.1 SDR family NAD(P)-dependent oxidoreductase [Nannocystis poenicansa]